MYEMYWREGPMKHWTKEGSFSTIPEAMRYILESETHQQGQWELHDGPRRHMSATVLAIYFN